MTTRALYDGTVNIYGPRGKVNSGFQISRTTNGLMWARDGTKPHHSLCDGDHVKKSDLLGALTSLYNNQSTGITSSSEISRLNSGLLDRIYKEVTRQ